VPQLWLLVWRFSQYEPPIPKLHSVSPLGHPHVPAVQTPPFAQLVPHLPQFWASVCRLAQLWPNPVHSVSLLEQTQLPRVHCAPLGQRL
jgi:hypothetical protein